MGHISQCLRATYSSVVGCCSWWYSGDHFNGRLQTRSCPLSKPSPQLRQYVFLFLDLSSGSYLSASTLWDYSYSLDGHRGCIGDARDMEKNTCSLLPIFCQGMRKEGTMLTVSLWNFSWTSASLTNKYPNFSVQ